MNESTDVNLLSRDALDQLHRRVNEDPKEALIDLQNYERDFPSDLNLRRNAGGFRIDIGTALRDDTLIALGIATIRTDLEGLSGPARRAALHNVANGCSSLHLLERAKTGYRFDPDIARRHRRVAKCPPPTYRSKRQSRYAQFCLQRNLFLNLRVGSRVCRHSTRDGVGISITTSLDDELTFPRLTHSLNEMKESFATARLLLFEAAEPIPGPSNFDSLTTYTDNLDYPVYGMGAGKTKMAFQAGYNVLDKIAFFLNDYLRLRIDKSDVSFSRVWRQSGKKPLRPEILAVRNSHLFGLHDVSCH